MTHLLTPPDDGGRNTVSIFGRLYQSTPGVPIAVPTFDVPTLEANGWTAFIGASPPATTSFYTAGAVSGVVKNPNGSPAGLAVRLYIDGSATPVGATISDVSGNWTVPTGTLPAGPHLYSLEIDESAGSFLAGPLADAGTMDFRNSFNSSLLAAIAA